jgi:hypothetical protein
LVLANDLRKDSFKSVCYGLSDNFEGDITERYGPEVTREKRVVFLRDEANVCLVIGAGVPSIVKHLKGSCADIMHNNVPISMVKNCW